MAKKRRELRPLKRSGPKRLPNLLVYIVTEGEKTEPQYLKDFASDVGNHLVRIELVDAGGDPKKLVDVACEFYRKKKKEAKKADNSFEQKFLVVALFDVDEHKRLNEALQKGRDNELIMGVSNPCFELWILLHFQYVSGYLYRQEAQRELKRVMREYDHKDNPVVKYEAIAGLYADARKRSEQLLREREKEDNPRGNPSTTVHHVLDRICQGGVKVGR